MEPVNLLLSKSTKPSELLQILQYGWNGTHPLIEIQPQDTELRQEPYFRWNGTGPLIDAQIQVSELRETT